MKIQLGGLLLAAVTLVSAQTSTRTAAIALYTSFQQQPTAAVRMALQDELESIMSPLGMRFEWRELHGESTGATPELAVVTFKGRCSVAGLSPAGSFDGTALGWTHIADGEILPFSDVDCDQIRGFLQHSLLHMTTTGREEVFGRALARILAHELYHIFADTTRHGSCGIAKEAYTVHDLLSANFRFEDRDTKVLKSGHASPDGSDRGVDQH